MKPALDTTRWLKPSIRHAYNLVSDYIRHVKADMKKDIANIIDNSCKDFSLTIDGYPIGDDAEAVCIRLIRNSDFKVIDLLLSLKLHNQKLSGDQIAKNVVLPLRENGYADLSGWRVCIMYRAGNNGVALKQFYETNIDNPVYSPCHSHTVNLTGKEFSKSSTLMEKLRKHWENQFKIEGNYSSMWKV